MAFLRYTKNPNGLGEWGGRIELADIEVSDWMVATQIRLPARESANCDISNIEFSSDGTRSAVGSSDLARLPRSTRSKSMIYNVNIALENQIRNARTDAALKDAVLTLASSIVSDLQLIDARRENGDDELRHDIEQLKRRVLQIEGQLQQIARRP